MGTRSGAHQRWQRLRLGRRLLVAGLVVALLGVSGAGPLPLALALTPAIPLTGPAAAAAPPTLVMRPARVTTADVIGWFGPHLSGYRATVPLATLVGYYQDEGNAQGIAWDVAFVQSVIETGWFTFPDSGQVRPSDNNFSGLGATNGGGGTNVAKFATAQLGVRAQMQHLWAYADPQATAAGTARPLVDPRFDLVIPKGKAPTWDQFGNGIWATAPDYASSILSRYDDLSTYAGVQLSRWIDKAYRDLLGRAVDPGGADFWLHHFAGRGDRNAIALALARQPEALSTFVDRSYRGLLGRPADAGGRAWWAQRLGAGLPLAELPVALLTSPEFSASLPAGDGAWVDGVYRAVLGRPADSGGLSYWVGLLATQSWTRANVVRYLWATLESRARRANATFTLVLARPADPAGLSWASGVLASADDLTLAATTEASQESYLLAQA